MPHLLLHQPHLHQTPLIVNHRRPQPPPATAFFLRCSVAAVKPTAAIGVSWRIRTGTMRCMANPRRVKMVAKQIRRELSDMLLTDKVLQFAVLPEAALGADRYLSSLTTISDVEVSSDLQHVYGGQLCHGGCLYATFRSPDSSCSDSVESLDYVCGSKIKGFSSYFQANM
ncbi:probable ribosome-binding factor A, chloroplastic [Camellia sinensis]|uniref:Uncharacterized protein n=1 Tax=Camellia sinensis var. sinensis TaxID=542762 RepID=A0A4S4E226_CAMSN|nr:probable ribosome-binding factor A, chloroplastic [Camellia sinensis]THG09878.1 hypothetical protein TEA_008697 [Camellia sinensis var. sinensis]